MSINRDKTYSWKLLTGEEVVFQVHEVGDDGFATVSHGARVVPMGNGQVGMVSWLYSVSIADEIKVNLNSLVTFSKTDSVTWDTYKTFVAKIEHDEAKEEASMEDAVTADLDTIEFDDESDDGSYTDDEWDEAISDMQQAKRSVKKRSKQ